MKKMWFEVKPIDRETAATMNFILLTCKEAHQWARGEKEDPEELIKRFSGLPEHSLTIDGVPKEALTRAITMGRNKDSFKNEFVVASRPSWTKVRQVHRRMTWEEYLSGKQLQTPPVGGRIVIPEKAIRDLMEHGRLAFSWGEVVFQNWYWVRLENYIEKLDIPTEEFLKSVEEVTFRHQDSGVWLLNFGMKSFER